MTNNSLPGRGARRNAFLAATLLGSLVTVQTAGAAVLENPADGSFRSGVSVLSGWACDATNVVIELTGTESSETVTANYGTPRADTATPSACGIGNEDNGFGALTNLNRLGTGPASAVLKVDGVVMDTNNFTITKPTDANFEGGLSATYTLPGFPGEGEAVDLVWNTSTQSFAIAPAGSSGTPAAAAGETTTCDSEFATKCNLENPGIYQFMSGILVFSGWVCDVASDIHMVIKGTDATETIPVSYGTDRADTETACGDIDNGFGALWMVNRIGSGPATAELWIDDELAVSVSFWVTKPSDANFNSTASGEFTLPGFPDPTKDTIVIWQAEDQNFSIKEVKATAGPTPTPAPGSIPTPGITPTPSPVPTATPDGGSTPTPTPDGGSTPTPTPSGGGAVCGNGIMEAGEQCDGDDYGDLVESCTDVFEGYHPVEDEPCLEGSELQCTNDCKIDGSLCICVCESDIDCALPEGELIDCGPSYCNLDFCSAEDVPDCECSIGDEGDIEGACVGSNFDQEQTGFCITTPFDAGENDSELEALCQGYDEEDIDFPRCEYCDF